LKTYHIKEDFSAMEIKTLGVVGAGQMGSGIAQVAAVVNLSVVMSDMKDEFLPLRIALAAWLKKKSSVRKIRKRY
jgi:3-hydroxybutyryl-CoA dehydrogenase